MGVLPYTSKQSCCLAVLPDLHTAGLACLELHLENPVDLAVSMLSKPGTDAERGDFLRVKSVGTVMCRGSIARTLKQQSIVRGDGLWEMTELLNLIGVPTDHEDIYDHALKSGLVVLVLQGNGGPLRQGCHILEDISMGKPVLYLV